VEEFGRAADQLAELAADPRTREFLTTPRVSPDQRREALTRALAGRVPDLFLRFVVVVLDKRRQGLLAEIAEQYRTLTDELFGRVRVRVTISHEPDAALQQEIERSLEARLGKDVIPTFTVDPELLGGLVVRLGDEILDGSVKSRAVDMRRRMLGAQLTGAGAR
jgi:F-type H+-transporting ATPase subunit delta